MNCFWLEDALQELEQRFISGRMAHACLIAGPEGLGKLELARQVAVTLLCQKQEAKACGVCRSCVLFAGGAHPDFRLLTFEVNQKNGKLRTELVIGQVRELNASMQLTNTISPRKVALLYPAEAMNRNTANALLKTLEEPLGEAVLLLVAHDPSRLAATIRSRCQKISVRLPDEQAAVNWLASQKKVDTEAARMALRASAGSPLRALRLLEQGNMEQFRFVEKMLVDIGAGEVAVAGVMDACSALDEHELWTWLSLISARRLRACFDRAGGTGKGHGESTARESGTHLHRQLCLLQSLADNNRRVLTTSLRKDLLLRDWLIQWSRLTPA